MFGQSAAAGKPRRPRSTLHLVGASLDRVRLRDIALADDALRAEAGR
jgi:hypothetical protein